VSSQSCSLYASNGGSDSSNGSQAAPFRSLEKLASSLRAGQVGCLQSGETFDSGENVGLIPAEMHGEAGMPVTITSTDPAEPATITHNLTLAYGVNYVVITHVDFNWSMPKPWECWNARGEGVSNEIISAPGKCTAGAASSEDAVQIGVDGKDDSLTYDDITSNDTNICIILGGDGRGWPEGNVIENDRIHNCGPPVESTSSGFPIANEEWGWHAHGVYDSAHGTIIKNNYIYDNSRDGVLFHGGGEGAVVEHNILDHNGAGVWFGENTNNRAAWNIITNSTSGRDVVDYGIGSYEAGVGNVATNNCLDGNESGEIEPHGGFTASDNKTGANPLYANAAQHEYTLQADSPCLGYGPNSAQPSGDKSSEGVPNEGDKSSEGAPPSSQGSASGEGEGSSVAAEARLNEVTISLGGSPSGADGELSTTSGEESSGSADPGGSSGASVGKKKHQAKRRRRPSRSRRAATASAHKRSHVHRESKSVAHRRS
jgi:hypothetical protein